MGKKGTKLTEEHKKKVTETMRRLSKEGLLGKSHLGKPSGAKGKHWKLSNEIRKKISENHTRPMLGKENNWGHHTEEAKRKIGLANKGKKRSEEEKRKMSKNHKGTIGKHTWINIKHHSDETRRKLSLVHKGHIIKEETRKKISILKKGIYPSEITKQKMRISRIKYIKETCGNIRPNIGHNEKQILDKLEQEIGMKIIRQYEVLGYFIDGYILELNLCIEIDERPKIKEKDIEREKEIKEELSKNNIECKFLRIRDYD